ncbi:hypothetical protein OH491_24530 [Termitidicoccus mucosus]|uniref:Uncharacterized protein n=1 Tax=Termitidicoccus mucosus TaxID=1184151 RepID=A0A178IP81_9BACT|nr:hypothetical protein AW736_01970 [Opitutaceae bacterium TSB47]
MLDDFSTINRVQVIEFFEAACMQLTVAFAQARCVSFLTSACLAASGWELPGHLVSPRCPQGGQAFPNGKLTARIAPVTTFSSLSAKFSAQ